MTETMTTPSVPPSEKELKELTAMLAGGHRITVYDAERLVAEIVRLRALLEEMADKTGPYFASERWADELYDRARKAARGEI